ncbi:hypothetical protein DTL42_12395 [Bremerella cremea]|uniref:Uncharacterized protein n=2 Tax=Bremerella cremea TaxID=1031537 RepID=A0A368KR22_9BACT|nr:hypothetical protein DTL42_12395 [Bremerella cremea]
MPELSQLIALFYAQPEKLGQFEEVSAEKTPPPFRQLLAHNEHMTVTVEKFHGCNVDVKVLETRNAGNFYSRKILLTRQRDGKVVQYGIVRLNCDYLDDEPANEIKSERIPLGRVLIQHNVLREVQLTSLWHVQPAAELRELMGLQPQETVYGRTALIYCNGEPAVELLEIVTRD